MAWSMFFGLNSMLLLMFLLSLTVSKRLFDLGRRSGVRMAM